MNKVLEYMAYELPVVGFDLAESASRPAPPPGSSRAAT